MERILNTLLRQGKRCLYRISIKIFLFGTHHDILYVEQTEEQREEDIYV